jgi:hypothetical protein
LCASAAASGSAWVSRNINLNFPLHNFTFLLLSAFLLIPIPSNYFSSLELCTIFFLVACTKGRRGGKSKEEMRKLCLNLCSRALSFVNSALVGTCCWVLWLRSRRKVDWSERNVTNLLTSSCSSLWQSTLGDFPLDHDEGLHARAPKSHFQRSESNRERKKSPLESSYVPHESFLEGK